MVVVSFLPLMVILKVCLVLDITVPFDTTAVNTTDVLLDGTVYFPVFDKYIGELDVQLIVEPNSPTLDKLILSDIVFPT